MVTTAHQVAVAQVGGRYPFRPTCSCGAAFWGYVAEHAAQDLAQAHFEECHAQQAPP